MSSEFQYWKCKCWKWWGNSLEKLDLQAQTKLWNTGVLQQRKTYVKFLLFACVLLFQTGSAILSVAFDLNFPPASCWFDKIDDDSLLCPSAPSLFIVFFDLFNRSVECEFCHSLRILFQRFDFVEHGQNQGNCWTWYSLIWINVLLAMCCLVHYLGTVLFMMMGAIR